MLVALDSPLRRLPIGLDRQQILFIDGARVSAEMVDIAYARLLQNLHRLSEPDCQLEERVVGIPSAMQDAWSIVDSTHRVRRLMGNMPRVKKKSAALQIFDRATIGVPDLRHVIQHLDEKVVKILSMGTPVWGTLQWLVLLDRTTFRMRACTIAPGTAFDAKHPVPNPDGATMRGPVDHVRLTAAGVELDLSDVFQEVVTLVRRMEKTLADRFVNLPDFGADLLTVVEMEPILDDSSGPTPEGKA